MRRKHQRRKSIRRKRAEIKKTPLRAAGYYTLEAALILPVIFMLSVSLIFLGFMLHDRLSLKSLTSAYAEKAAEAARGAETGDGRMDVSAFGTSFSGPFADSLSEESGALLSEKLYREAEQKTLLFVPQEAAVYQEGREAVARVSGSFPVKAVRLIAGSSDTEQFEEHRRITLRQAELLRIVRGIWKKEE